MAEIEHVLIQHRVRVKGSEHWSAWMNNPFVGPRAGVDYEVQERVLYPASALAAARRAGAEEMREAAAGTANEILDQNDDAYGVEAAIRALPLPEAAE